VKYPPAPEWNAQVGVGHPTAGSATATFAGPAALWLGDGVGIATAFVGLTGGGAGCFGSAGGLHAAISAATITITWRTARL
jgi:hypothetical protein